MIICINFYFMLHKFTCSIKWGHVWQSEEKGRRKRGREEKMKRGRTSPLLQIGVWFGEEGKKEKEKRKENLQPQKRFDPRAPHPLPLSFGRKRSGPLFRHVDASEASMWWKRSSSTSHQNTQRRGRGGLSDPHWPLPLSSSLFLPAASKQPSPKMKWERWEVRSAMRLERPNEGDEMDMSS